MSAVDGDALAHHAGAQVEDGDLGDGAVQVEGWSPRTPRRSAARRSAAGRRTRARGESRWVGPSCHRRPVSGPGRGRRLRRGGPRSAASGLRGGGQPHEPRRRRGERRGLHGLVVRPRAGGHGRTPRRPVAAERDRVPADGPVGWCVLPGQVRQAGDGPRRAQVEGDVVRQWRGRRVVRGMPEGQTVAVENVDRRVRGRLVAGDGGGCPASARQGRVSGRVPDQSDVRGRRPRAAVAGPPTARSAARTGRPRRGTPRSCGCGRPPTSRW